MPSFPQWLTGLAIASLVVAFICALIIAADLLRGNKQNMWIMNVVWPVTALYSGPLALYAYFKVGRLSTYVLVQASREAGKEPPNKAKPFWQTTGVGATHCGSGCTVGDIIAEWFIFAVPLTLFGKTIFAGWAIDFAAAYILGIAFQYFTIKPMKQLSPRAGVIAAIKADTASLTAWQVGMYGWMAIATFGIFGFELAKTSAVFWFMMQIAMLFGFLTAYPVNWWLLKRGIKEPM